MAQTGRTALAAIVLFLSCPRWSVSIDLRVCSSNGTVYTGRQDKIELNVTCPALTSLNCEVAVSLKEHLSRQLKLVWTGSDERPIVTSHPGQLKLPLSIALKSEKTKFICRLENGHLHKRIVVIVRVTQPSSSISACQKRCAKFRKLARRFSCCSKKGSDRTVKCSTDGRDEQRSVDVLGSWTSWSRCFQHVRSRRRNCYAPSCRTLPLVEVRYCRKPLAGNSSSEIPLQSAARVHEVVKRSSSKCSGNLWAPWSQWSACSNGQQSRNRACCFSNDVCTVAGGPGSELKACSTQKVQPTTAIQTTSGTVLVPTVSTTTIHHQAKTKTRLIATSLPAKRTTSRLTATKPATRPTILPHPPTTRHAITQPSQHFPSTSHAFPPPGTTFTHTTAVQTKRTPGGSRNQPSSRGSTTHRTDSYNLRVTVAVSSGLVGSLLLVAVVACWRRLHLEQLEQQRQLLQPEATQPEYHGLQHRSLQQAPPPTYHDAFQLDTMQQESQQSGANSSSQQPVSIASATSTSSGSRSSGQTSSTSGSNQTTSENSGQVLTAISHKVRTNYMLSRLKAGMTEDEMPLDDDDVLSQSDALPLL